MNKLMSQGDLEVLASIIKRMNNSNGVFTGSVEFYSAATDNNLKAEVRYDDRSCEHIVTEIFVVELWPHQLTKCSHTVETQPGGFFGSVLSARGSS